MWNVNQWNRMFFSTNIFELMSEQVSQVGCLVASGTKLAFVQSNNWPRKNVTEFWKLCSGATNEASSSISKRDPQIFLILITWTNLQETFGLWSNMLLGLKDLACISIKGPYRFTLKSMVGRQNYERLFLNTDLINCKLSFSSY